MDIRRIITRDALENVFIIIFQKESGYNFLGATTYATAFITSLNIRALGLLGNFRLFIASKHLSACELYAFECEIIPKKEIGQAHQWNI